MRYSILLAFGVNPLLLFFVCDLVGTIDLFRLKFFEGEMWGRLDLAMYPIHSGELANDCNSLIFKFFSFPPFMDITYHSFSLRKSLNDDDTHTTTTKKLLCRASFVGCHYFSNSFFVFYLGLVWREPFSQCS